MPAADAGRQCYFCSEPCDEADFCYGCAEHVCDDCNVNDEIPFGGHDVAVHQEEPGDVV